MNICTEESVSYKLEAVIAFCFHKMPALHKQLQLSESLDLRSENHLLCCIHLFLHLQCFHRDVQSAFPGIGSFYPVDRSFYFTSVRSVSAFGCRIISTVYNSSLYRHHLLHILYRLQNKRSSDVLHVPAKQSLIFTLADRSMKSSRSIYNSLPNGILRVPSASFSMLFGASRYSTCPSG